VAKYGENYNRSWALSLNYLNRYPTDADIWLGQSKLCQVDNQECAIRIVRYFTILHQSVLKRYKANRTYWHQYSTANRLGKI